MKRIQRFFGEIWRDGLREGVWIVCAFGVIFGPFALAALGVDAAWVRWWFWGIFVPLFAVGILAGIAALIVVTYEFGKWLTIAWKRSRIP
jgi:hypothetical protein